MSAGYRIGLVLAAAVMVLLPVLYCAALIGLGFLLYFHATMHTAWMDEFRTAAAYMVFLLGGATLFFAMLKPLAAPAGEKARPIVVETQQAPALFKLISIISQKAGAPLPATVELDCEVASSAAFVRGPARQRRNSLTLTIGMPLVAGLTQRQLASVIAYELGHFNQTGAARLLWTISSVHSWFRQAALMRDQWDESIVEAIGVSGFFARGILRVIQACVLLGRVVLLAFLAACHAVSCVLLRRMDHDADGWSIAVAGSTAFTHALGRVRDLAAAEDSLWPELMAVYGDEPLPVDLPGLMVTRCGEQAAKGKQAPKAAMNRKRGLLNGHQKNAERLAHAKTLPSAGMPWAERPASALLPDFEQLCRDVTGRRYGILPPPEFFRAGNRWGN
jgi:hypothetical protein